jgi:hypothetical protein
LLSADLSARLDLGSALDGLLGGLAGPTATLEGTQAPPEAGEAQGAAQLSVSVEVTGLDGAVGRVTAGIPALLAGLPGPGEAVGTLARAVEMVERVSAGDVPGQVRSLIEALRTALEESDEGDFLAVLQRLRALLAERPEARALWDLLAGGAAAGGVDIGPAAGAVAGILPAAVGTLRALAALMSLESTLAEGERLTGIMAAQLDPADVERELGALRGAFELALGRLRALAEAGADAPEGLSAQAVAEVTAAATRLALVEELLARAMGFGEATLVHFDVARIEADVRAGADLLRGVDTDAVGRAVGALVRQLAPALRLELDVAAAPAGGLDGLLALLEGKAGEIAAAIAALDLSPVSRPVAQGIEFATAPLAAVSEVVERVTGAVRGALEQVRQGVAAIPVEEIASAIRALLGPVARALDFARELVARIEAALRAVAETVTGALEGAEAAIDAFVAETDRLLGEAADFVESLNLDAVAGEVAERVRALAGALAAAEMRPYFDTTVDIVDTTTAVLEELPLGLLPDDVKAELDAAVAPVRAIDVAGVEETVEGWLQIDADGKFAARGILEASIAEVQAGYDALVAAVRQGDPRRLAEPIEAELAKLRERVAALSPELGLQPVQDAVDRVRGALAAVDPEALLRPVDDAFARVLEAVDGYAPERLLGDVVARVDAARAKVVGELRLDEWGPALDWAADGAKALAARLDPSGMEDALRASLADADAFLANAGGGVLALPFGDMVAAMAGSAGLRTDPRSFGTVWGWLRGAEGGGGALGARGARIEANVAATRAAVVAVDLPGLALELGARSDALGAALAALPADSPARAALEPVAARLRPRLSLSFLDANRARYLATLAVAVERSGSLRRVGLAQVDDTVDGLRAAFSPGALLGEFLRALLGRLGITGLEEGIQGVVRRVLAVATPERLAAVARPIAEALRGKVEELVDALLAPLQAGVARLRSLVEAVDLRPFVESLSAIHAEARGRIEALSPRTLLAAELASFAALKAELDGFDPLAPVRAVLDALRETALRVLAKLDAEALLRNPVRIYDEIVAALAVLDLGALMSPVLDTLDSLAAQVDEGLDRTTAALERLQAALPAPGSGGGSASVSVSATLTA